jgi:hypothetical protein
MKAQVLDAMEALRSQTFSVSVDFESVGDQAPPMEAAKRQIQAWLEGMDPDDVEADLKTGKSPPSLRLTPGTGWVIVLEAFPIAREYRDESPGRLIGVGPISVGPVNDVEKIRNAISRKLRKYPRLAEPVVLAVLSVSSFAGSRDFEQALIGSHAVRYSVGAKEPATWVRLRDGAWMPNRGTRISAALTAADLTPSQVALKLPLLWRNPWAVIGWDAIVPLPEVRIRKDGAVTHPDAAGEPARIFGLDPNWPGFDAPP